MILQRATDLLVAVHKASPFRGKAHVHRFLWKRIDTLLVFEAEHGDEEVAYEQGRRWAGAMPDDGTMPSTALVKAFNPILKKRGLIL